MIPALTLGLGGVILWAIIGYLLGSVPYGVLLARAMNLGNLREIGSGNIGATNVLRTGNKKAAALTLLFDAAKGAVAVLLARALAGEEAAQIAALFAFLGHCLLIVAALFRYSSLAALMAAGCAPGFMLLMGYSNMAVLGVILAVLVYWRHAANIGRLRNGTEPKIGKK